MERLIEIVNTKNGNSLRFDGEFMQTVEDAERLIDEYWDVEPGTYVLRKGAEIISSEMVLESGATYYVVPTPLPQRDEGNRRAYKGVEGGAVRDGGVVRRGVGCVR